MGTGGMDLDDPGWTRLVGGYHVPYDPRKALRALERGESPAIAWRELWSELYHQGDVGEASYAAVPHLVRIHASRRTRDWNTYALVAMIDEARRDGRNPELPAGLRAAYDAAWSQLVHLGLHELGAAEDPPLVSSIISVLAIGKASSHLVDWPSCIRKVSESRFSLSPDCFEQSTFATLHANTKQPAAVSRGGLFRCVHRDEESVLCRPGSDLLFQALRLSTIGAGEFNGRVRDGIGFGLPAGTTRPAKDG
jgi:hypothetical protein